MTLSVAFCPAFCQKQRQTTKLPPGRYMRVTTGSVEVKGWEHNLVERTPNLARWHWDPLYSTTQGYRSVPGGSGSPGSYYIKPIHAATVTSPKSHYTKPIHVPFNVPDKQREMINILARGTMRSENLDNQSTNTYIKLKNHPEISGKNEAVPLVHKTPEHTDSYATTYDKEIGVSKGKTSASVYGLLKSR